MVRLDLAIGWAVRVRNGNPKIIAMTPTPPPDDLRLAREQARRGDLAAALASYSRAALSPQSLLPAVREGARLAITHGAAMPALQLLDQGLRAHPGTPDLHALLAVAHRAAGRLPAAAAAAERALQLDPAEVMAAAVLADLALSHGMPCAALKATDTAIARHPGAAVLWRDRGRAMLDRGEPEAATQALRQSFVLNPGDPATRGSLCLASLYDTSLDAGAVRALHLEVAKAAPAQPTNRADALRSTPTGERPLRVGVLSADLRTHPVGVFVGNLFAHADPARVAWIVYDNGSRDPARVDPVTTRLRARAQHWKDVAALADGPCIELMRQDHLDVLLDLSGHTAGGRPAVIAARVAPMQIAYLGYPAPSGARGIDAMIADEFVVPAGDEQGWPERILRLPHAFLCYEPYPGTPDVVQRALDAPFTFGSFNNLAKLDDATLALWCRVLHATPAARLLLCATTLGEAATVDFTRRRFAAQGIGADRVACAPPVASPAQLLARYAEVDVALDPLRFNGGTTTLDALWQGVPVVTLPGAIMPSRMAASVLVTAGLEEFIARDPDDYVALTARAAGDRAGLATLRSALRERLTATSLVDGTQFAASFTDLLECAGRAASR